MRMMRMPRLTRLITPVHEWPADQFRSVQYPNIAPADQFMTDAKKSLDALNLHNVRIADICLNIQCANI